MASPLCASDMLSSSCGGGIFESFISILSLTLLANSCSLSFLDITFAPEESLSALRDAPATTEEPVFLVALIFPVSANSSSSDSRIRTLGRLSMSTWNRAAVDSTIFCNSSLDFESINSLTCGSISSLSISAPSSNGFLRDSKTFRGCFLFL